jgi:hypothetical protein
MKFSTTALWFATVACTTQAFAPSSYNKVGSTASASTAAAASRGNNWKRAAFFDTSKGQSSKTDTEPKNPVKDIQSYIPSPDSVEVRPNLEQSTCIVSGSKRIPLDLFYLLNHEDSAFGFKKIVSISDDVKASKKQLLTRQARYTGLLDKLDYESSSFLPTSTLLEEASSWIAVIDNLDDLKMMTQYVGQVENVAILYTSMTSMTTTEAETETFQALKVANPNVSLVVVDQDAIKLVEQDTLILEKKRKAVPLLYFDFDSSSQDDDDDKVVDADVVDKVVDAVVDDDKVVDAVVDDKVVVDVVEEEASIDVRDPVFLNEEALRLVTECLQLQAAAGKTISLSLVENDTVSPASSSQSSKQLFPRLIKGLREAGFNRSQEIDYMLRMGVKHYAKAIYEFETANPSAKDGVVYTDAWWEDEKFQKSVKQSSLRKEELMESNREREERLLEKEQAEKFA